jgi:hypothetical protein
MFSLRTYFSIFKLGIAFFLLLSFDRKKETEDKEQKAKPRLG